MRLWSLHPKYLDAKGIVALWRETLLAKHVLEGKTKGYTNHPQLNRFKNSGHAVNCINQYLSTIYENAVLRGYNFDKSKINWDFEPKELTVTNGQISYETKHLLNKLKVRDADRFYKLSSESEVEVHPIFKIINGEIEQWEIV